MKKALYEYLERSVVELLNAASEDDPLDEQMRLSDDSPLFSFKIQIDPAFGHSRQRVSHFNNSLRRSLHHRGQKRLKRAFLIRSS